MTAPDKIYAWCFNANDDGSWGDWGGYARPANMTPLDDKERKTGSVYTRTDLSNALIAAAYEAAGEVAAVFVHERLYKAKFPACSYHHADIKAAVKALTPPDAQAALQVMIDAARAEGFLNGFLASGEGYNGEYPFGDNGESPDNNTEWIEIRDMALAKIGGAS